MRAFGGAEGLGLRGVIRLGLTGARVESQGFAQLMLMKLPFCQACDGTNGNSCS